MSTGRPGGSGGRTLSRFRDPRALDCFANFQSHRRPSPGSDCRQCTCGQTLCGQTLYRNTCSAPSQPCPRLPSSWCHHALVTLISSASCRRTSAASSRESLPRRSRLSDPLGTQSRLFICNRDLHQPCPATPFGQYNHLGWSLDRHLRSSRSLSRDQPARACLRSVRFAPERHPIVLLCKQYTTHSV